MIKDKLEELFDMKKDDAPKLPAVPSPKAEDTEAEKELDESHEYALIKIKKLMELGEEVASEAAEMAISTGDPESVKAVSGLIKNLGDIAKSVLTSTTEKMKAKNFKKIADNKQAPTDGNPSTVNNTQYVFNGTTSDLLKQLKEGTKTIDGVVKKDDPV